MRFISLHLLESKLQQHANSQWNCWKYDIWDFYLSRGTRSKEYFHLIFVTWLLVAFFSREACKSELGTRLSLFLQFSLSQLSQNATVTNSRTARNKKPLLVACVSLQTTYYESYHYNQLVLFLLLSFFRSFVPLEHEWWLHALTIIKNKRRTHFLSNSRPATTNSDKGIFIFRPRDKREKTI